VWRLPILVMLGLLAADAAQAQNFITKGDDPIVVEADDGIEWLRDDKKYIARGNARAARSGIEVLSDVLTAFYREKKDGKGQEVFRLDADGNVRIKSRDEQAFGDKGVYYVDDSVFVMVGENLRLVANRGTITARDKLEYWDKRQVFVARGDAVVVSDDKRLKANTLVAYIGKNAKGKQEIQRIDAIANVHISTATEIIRADEGVYNLISQIATLRGNVKITRDDNQLNGDEAIVDLKSGISRLLGTRGRVKGLIMPRR
jgi:lipopolysaccharide export system protein LptA